MIFMWSQTENSVNCNHIHTHESILDWSGANECRQCPLSKILDLKTITQFKSVSRCSKFTKTRAYLGVYCMEIWMHKRDNQIRMMSNQER